MAAEQNRAKQRKTAPYSESDGEDEGDRFGCEGDGRRRAAMESHCEIERRRRNRMAAYVNELADMIPSCNTPDRRRPDKLSILKLAADHLKSLQAPGSNSGDSKPSFLSDQELKRLVLEATSGFLFVVLCETGQIIYASDTVNNVLGYSQFEWYSENLYSMIHPDDREKLRHHLFATETETNLLDIKCDVAVRSESTQVRNMTGCRRAFILRMRVGNLIKPNDNKDFMTSPTDSCSYAIIHVTGYIRNWPPSTLDGSCGNVASGNQRLGSKSCLVAIGRQHSSVHSSVSSSSVEGVVGSPEFMVRLSLDGKFTFVDGRVTQVVGYKPQELLSRQVLEFCHPDDQLQLRETFDQVVKRKGQMSSVVFRFLSKSQEFVWLRMNCATFLNPFSDDVEYIVCTCIKTSMVSLPLTACADFGIVSQSGSYSNISNTVQQTSEFGYDIPLEANYKESLPISQNLTLNVEPLQLISSKETWAVQGGQMLSDYLMTADADEQKIPISTQNNFIPNTSWSTPWPPSSSSSDAQETQSHSALGMWQSADSVLSGQNDEELCDMLSILSSSQEGLMNQLVYHNYSQ